MPTMLLLNSGDMPSKKMKDGRVQRTCLQCEFPWFSQKGVRPQRCPSCNSRAWDRPKGKAGRPKDAKPKRKESTKGRKAKRGK